MRRAGWQAMVDEWEQEEVDPIETPEAAYRQGLIDDVTLPRSDTEFDQPIGKHRKAA